MKALANLPVRGQRNNVDWGDEVGVAAQQEKVLQVVSELKNHPAVALWAIGNELDWIPPGIPYHPQLWARLNDLAIAIHKIDPHHPVMTVVGTGRFEEKIQVIARECPDLDLLGINTYGDIAQVAKLAQQHWPRPYVIAEWGPTGHWQVPKTRWRVPLEQTSSQKAEVTLQRYQDVILGDPDHCLGSFVFLWGQKQETTHTWYGMFLDGKRTESVDVMQFEWTGGWPANRVPQVRGLEIAGCPDPASTYLQPSQAGTAEVDCLDPDQDPLTFRWDIRPEVEIPQNSYAGGLEKPAQPIPDLIPDPNQRQIRFTAPARPGAVPAVRRGRGRPGPRGLCQPAVLRAAVACAPQSGPACTDLNTEDTEDTRRDCK